MTRPEMRNILGDPSITPKMMNDAMRLIYRAETDLGALTSGQRRDLLADNTEFSMEVIREIVARLIAKGL